MVFISDGNSEHVAHVNPDPVVESRIRIRYTKPESGTPTENVAHASRKIMSFRINKI